MPVKEKADMYKKIEIMLSEHFGQQVSIHSFSTVGGGCINHASKLETDLGPFFLKWNSDCPGDMFIREAQGLKEMKKASGGSLIIPEVYAVSSVGVHSGFIVLEYLRPGSGDDVAFGRGLAEMHKFTNDRYGFFDDNYCGTTPQDNSWKTNWTDFFRDNRLRFLLGQIQRRRAFSVGEMKIYDKLLDRIPELLPEKSTPVLIHGDLWSGNYMMTDKGPSLIDPAAYYADREMEMSIMTLFGGFSGRFYDAYNEINPLPSGWKERNKLYRLYHILNHYHLFGGGYGSQALHVAKMFI
ncbi:MAG: fructosamine kinase family protein [Bacteroidales bacterium]|nr:fructosamine kinase family protein [Bacteroidales bacterium]